MRRESEIYAAEIIIYLFLQRFFSGIWVLCECVIFGCFVENGWIIYVNLSVVCVFYIPMGGFSDDSEKLSLVLK